MYKTLSKHLQHGEGSERTLSPETMAYEKRKNDKICTISSAHKGKMVVGKITKLMEYGAFVDINGVSGFVHISELSNRKITDIGKELTLGCSYEFKIVEIGLNKKGNISFKLTRKLDPCRQEDTGNKCVFEKPPLVVEKNNSPKPSTLSVQKNGFSIGEILSQKNSK